ncbi:MAG: Hsp20/alpha crystallin family protein [candidate division WOR-3 bacterium]
MNQDKINNESICLSEIKVIYERNDTSVEEYEETFIHWQPPYDLYVIDEKIYIIVELAGVDVKNITVRISQNYMTISGIKKPLIDYKKSKGRNIVFHNLEISYGFFSRRIEFPLPVDPTCGDYRMEQGVLTIKLPVLKEHVIPIE